MQPTPSSLEDLIRASSRALVVGVGGGGDVVGALAAARFLEFCGLGFVLGGLSWERNVYDPIPGPRKFGETRNVRVLHPFAWMANADSQTDTGVFFAESRMAAALAQAVLLIDINGGAAGVVDGIEIAMQELQADLLDCAVRWQIRSCWPRLRNWQNAAAVPYGACLATAATAS